MQALEKGQLVHEAQLPQPIVSQALIQSYSEDLALCIWADFRLEKRQWGNCCQESQMRCKPHLLLPLLQ